MKRPSYNFSVYQGADEVFPFAFYTEENSVETPVNLKDCTFLMTLRQSYNKPVVDMLSSENGRILVGTISDGSFEISSESPNAIAINFPHEVTIEYVFPSAIYDLFKINSNGDRELLLQGTIDIDKSVCYG